MYFAVVVSLMLILPAASIAIEDICTHHAMSTVFLAGRWFVFWAIGVRLFIAGTRQVIQPQFTASEIFGIHEDASFPIVREIGFANLSMGLLGIVSLFRTDWIVPAAIVGGLYYGLAGLGHVPHKNKNAKEYSAMISDAWVFLILLCFVINKLS